MAIVVAIYSTLGLAAKLAGMLQNRGLIDDFFFFCFLLVLATIVILGLKLRPRGIEIGVALGVTAVYLLRLARMATPVAERTHLVEYGVVAVGWSGVGVLYGRIYQFNSKTSIAQPSFATN